MPSALRYPIFLAGLVVMIVFGVVALHVNAPLDAEVALASAGFVLLAISVAIR
ncbi:MAG TPA: hypothetical protein VJN71_01095 [Nitrososphaerales archaeon]|nr:hypothetical protein [Nitrososphaerales archaeon]